MPVLSSAQANLLLDRFRDLVAELEERDPPYRLRLPNLRISMCDVSVGGGVVRINVDVQNNGLAVSGECDVQGVVEIFPPGGPQPPATQRCPKLPPGGIKRFRPFHSFQSPGDDHFVNVNLVVDPPTQDRPGGEVWESDETDNTKFCGIYTTIQEPEEPPDVDKPMVPVMRPDPPLR